MGRTTPELGTLRPFQSSREAWNQTLNHTLKRKKSLGSRHFNSGWPFSTYYHRPQQTAVDAGFNSTLVPSVLDERGARLIC